MLVSVIVPAFNSAADIAQSVRSALNQTLEDIEVIVVNDGSTDETTAAATAAANGDPRVTILESAENGGAARARNTAIRAARGTWIALLDADDSYEPERLATLVPEATARKADLLADNLCVIWEDGRYEDHPAFPALRMAEREAVSAAAFIASDRPRWGLRAAGYMKPIVRREFLMSSRIRYAERRRKEDFHFYVECLLHGALLAYTPYTGYRYTVRAASLSGSPSGKNLAGQIDSNRALEQLALEREQPEAAAELRLREIDLHRWNECLQLRQALQLGRVEPVLKTFWHMSAKRYALARIAEKAAKDAAARLGFSHYYGPIDGARELLEARTLRLRPEK